MSNTCFLRSSLFPGEVRVGLPGVVRRLTGVSFFSILGVARICFEPKLAFVLLDILPLGRPSNDSKPGMSIVPHGHLAA